MSKLIKFTIADHIVEAGITKIDRDKVYGFVQEMVTDINGKPCTLANLLDDGSTIIHSGSTAIKTTDSEYREVEKQQLKTVDFSGNDAILVPSSFDSGITLKEGCLDDVFNLEVKTIYQLTWENPESKAQMLKILEGDRIFTFMFNFRADYEGADGILLQNKLEVYALTGQLLSFDYLENKKIAESEDFADISAEEEKELDFGML